MATEIKPNPRAKRRENIGPYAPAPEGQPKAEYRSQHEANAEGKVRTYEAGRILDIGYDKRLPGELVPEAHTWFRLQNLVHTGYLISVEISMEDFTAAVQQYCPELADQLATLITIKEKDR